MHPALLGGRRRTLEGLDEDVADITLADDHRRSNAEVGVSGASRSFDRLLHRRSSADEPGRDWLPMLIPPAAFVGRTMAQRSTALDAVAPEWTSNLRYAAATRRRDE
jgi:hypothetical protein